MGFHQINPISLYDDDAMKLYHPVIIIIIIIIIIITLYEDHLTRSSL